MAGEQELVLPSNTQKNRSTGEVDLSSPRQWYPRTQASHLPWARLTGEVFLPKTQLSSRDSCHSIFQLGLPPGGCFMATGNCVWKRDIPWYCLSGKIPNWVHESTPQINLFMLKPRPLLWVIPSTVGSAVSSTQQLGRGSVYYFLSCFASGKISQTAKVGRTLFISSDKLLFHSYNWDYFGLRSALSNVQGEKNPPPRTSFPKSGPSFNSLLLSIKELRILRPTAPDQQRPGSSPTWPAPVWKDPLWGHMSPRASEPWGKCGGKALSREKGSILKGWK